jgi:hypothetical protein
MYFLRLHVDKDIGRKGGQDLEQCFSLSKKSWIRIPKRVYPFLEEFLQFNSIVDWFGMETQSLEYPY